MLAVLSGIWLCRVFSFVTCGLVCICFDWFHFVLTGLSFFLHFLHCSQIRLPRSLPISLTNPQRPTQIRTIPIASYTTCLLTTVYRGAFRSGCQSEDIPCDS